MRRAIGKFLQFVIGSDQRLLGGLHGRNVMHKNEKLIFTMMVHYMTEGDSRKTHVIMADFNFKLRISRTFNNQFICFAIKKVVPDKRNIFDNIMFFEIAGLAIEHLKRRVIGSLNIAALIKYHNTNKSDFKDLFQLIVFRGYWASNRRRCSSIH